MPSVKRNQVPANLWQSIKPHQSLRHFECAIIQFHYMHKTPIRQLPYVLGKKINLRKLYISVIKRGGYKKVNEKEAWDDVLSDLNLPKEATNSELAIQTIYHRYLEDYERNQWNNLNSASFVDSNIENNQLDIDFSKHSTFISELAVRDKSCLASFVYENTPKLYSDYRHIISNMSRLEFGLSCDLKESSELRHLIMSLKSGLCNEIDFALNSLLIMSNNDRISLDLRFTGELLDLLIAMAGIVDIRSGSYYEQFKSSDWMKDSLKFWNRVVEDGVGRMFLVPNIFTCSKTDVKQIQRDSAIIYGSGSTGLFNDDNQYHKITDSCCQRVHLVATIIHNLATKSLFNCQTLVNSNQTLRFLLLAVHSRDSVLRRLSLHTLTKLRFVLYPIQDCPEPGLKTLIFNPDISVDMDAATDKEEDSEEEWFTEFLLDFLMSLLSSENRCDRISAFEMIQSLSLIEDNHETLSKHLQNQFIVRISSQLLVPDIHPLCCALEALVALSQLGDDMCRRMAMCKSLLKCLLQFVNIEAQMFGPTAVYKIKTFNCRPPIPATNYHSLRLPAQSSFRALAPFAPPTPAFIPNSSNHPIRSPIVNSISAQSLSKPLNFNPQIQSPPHNVNANLSKYINNNHIPPSKSQLTPFQQIDHLLTKTIASFSSPPPIQPHPVAFVSQSNETTEETLDPKNEDESVTDADVSYVKIESSEEKSPKEKNERRIVKIKCCVEGVDLEIEDINGANRLNKQLCLVNGTSENGIEVNCDGEPKLEKKSELDKLIEGDTNELSPTMEKDQQYIHHNGTLELDMPSDEDPDRRQMPPPSLPTPSMLKKQLRPKSFSAVPTSPPPAMTNGFLSQQQSIDDRYEQVKNWLKKNFQVTEDVKLFVAKHQLIEEMNDALFDFDDGSELSAELGSKMALSAQELHNCIKEIFGQKVQVKVEHGQNGSSQLIYSHLGRIDPDVIPKSLVSNGLAVQEMNGFVHHTSKRKASHADSDDETEEKKVCEEEEKVVEELENEETNTSVVDRIPLKKRLRSRKKPPTIATKLKHKYKLCKEKHTRAVSKIHTVAPPHKPSSQHNKDQIAPSIPYQGNLPQIPQSYLICLWNQCHQGYISEGSLQTHVTNDHLDSPSVITSSSSPVSSPTRTYCKWRDCPSGQILRAPLSLLSHVIQEHCTAASYPQPSLQTSSPTTRPVGPPVTNYNVAMSPTPFNGPAPSLNAMVSSPMKSVANIGVSNNQMLEKSGWSVLYDHYRLDEQLQSNLPEGPITKHIRISSSIILRNMSRHSIIAKEFLRSNEKYLASVAMNSQDCSSIIVQCLDELSRYSCPVESTTVADDELGSDS